MNAQEPERDETARGRRAGGDAARTHRPHAFLILALHGLHGALRNPSTFVSCLLSIALPAMSALAYLAAVSGESGARILRIVVTGEHVFAASFAAGAVCAVFLLNGAIEENASETNATFMRAGVSWRTIVGARLAGAVALNAILCTAALAVLFALTPVEIRSASRSLAVAGASLVGTLPLVMLSTALTVFVRDFMRGGAFAMPIAAVGILAPYFQTHLADAGVFLSLLPMGPFADAVAWVFGATAALQPPAAAAVYGAWLLVAAACLAAAMRREPM